MLQTGKGSISDTLKSRLRPISACKQQTSDRGMVVLAWADVARVGLPGPGAHLRPSLCDEVRCGMNQPTQEG